MSMRGMWYVFKRLDKRGYTQFPAQQVRDIQHWPSGWRVFAGTELSRFFARSQYEPPYIVSGRETR